jgi:hypothetical protein
MDSNSEVAQNAVAFLNKLLTGVEGTPEHDLQHVADHVRRYAEDNSANDEHADRLEQFMRPKAAEIIGVDSLPDASPQS